ncbi:MAG: LytTR family DNA-binding domain-containing protein [Flavobacteriaceae bacterium]|nr:LytTR family DNA-binding domain-containing protein [Flavobacteriaceae bacterium]
MSTIKPSYSCIIIEDEIASQNVLVQYIKDSLNLELIGVYANAILAQQDRDHWDQVDLLFLDIHMPKLTGLEFLKTLSTPKPVIFTTAYSEYAVEAFQIQAIDYLLKPFSFERFLRAVDKFIATQAHSSPKKEAILIKENKSLYRIRYQDLLYIEAKGDYVQLHLENERRLTHARFSTFLTQLPSNFVRCHKSYAVNIHYIQSISGKYLQLINFKVPIGATYKEAFLKQISLQTLFNRNNYNL